jgi:hypothetical protein
MNITILRQAFSFYEHCSTQTGVFYEHYSSESGDLFRILQYRERWAFFMNCAVLREAVFYEYCSTLRGGFVL